MYRAALTPSCLALVGRSLMRAGELVLLIRVEDGMLKLQPASSHDVRGGPDPAGWTYRCVVPGPDTQLTYEHVPATSVLHFRYATDAVRPWRGLAPLTVAALAGRLSASTISALADEAGGPRGAFLPLPKDGGDTTLEKLGADVRGANGEVLFVEAGDWGAASDDKRTSWQTKRFGADPPQGLVSLAERASGEVMAACGVSSSLWDTSDGTSKRESYRQVLFGLIAPLGRQAAEELTTKLEVPVSLDWSELRAADVVGRARAFQSMTTAGMDPAKAAALAGLMIDD